MSTAVRVECQKPGALGRLRRNATRAVLCLGALTSLILSSGCTSRGMTITSEPPGAEVSINRRVVGTTPIRVGYTHYGTYRIELRKFEYEVMVREENIHPPVYGYDPVAAVADNLAPARLDDEIYLHYALKPRGAKAEKAEAPDGKAEQVSHANDEKSALDRSTANKAALLARATAARGGTVTHPRTGETIQVAIGPELNKKTKVADQTDLPVTIETYSTIGPSLSPNLELPTALAPVRMIDAVQPQGPSLGRQYGIVSDTPGEGPTAFVKPEEAKKAAAPTAIRTPRDEELIYDRPAISDPAEKKK